jgi:hypothetical protein
MSECSDDLDESLVHFAKASVKYEERSEARGLPLQKSAFFTADKFNFYSDAY